MYYCTQRCVQMCPHPHPQLQKYNVAKIRNVKPELTPHTLTLSSRGSFPRDLGVGCNSLLFWVTPWLQRDALI